MCVATRVATGFRAGCHHAKGKCGITQKKIKKTLNITLHQSLIQRHKFKLICLHLVKKLDCTSRSYNLFSYFGWLKGTAYTAS